MPEHTHPPADTARILHTPTAAAEILSMKESWLRRAAGRRIIPSTKIGKHLRFSTQDLNDIAARGQRPARRPRAHRTQRNRR